MCHLSDETLDYRDTRSQAQINAETRKTPEEHAKEKEVVAELRLAVDAEYEAKAEFKKELQQLIHRFDLGIKSRTSDSIIADYLSDCFDSFSHAIDCRDISTENK